MLPHGPPESHRPHRVPVWSLAPPAEGNTVKTRPPTASRAATAHPRRRRAGLYRCGEGDAEVSIQWQPNLVTVAVVMGYGGYGADARQRT